MHECKVHVSPGGNTKEGVVAEEGLPARHAVPRWEAGTRPRGQSRGQPCSEAVSAEGRVTADGGTGGTAPEVSGVTDVFRVPLLVLVIQSYACTEIHKPVQPKG